MIRDCGLRRYAVSSKFTLEGKKPKAGEVERIVMGGISQGSTQVYFSAIRSRAERRSLLSLTYGDISYEQKSITRKVPTLWACSAMS